MRARSFPLPHPAEAGAVVSATRLTPLLTDLEEFRRCDYPTTPWKKTKEIEASFGAQGFEPKEVLFVPHY